MSYFDDLQDLRWFAKRHWILQRDEYTCKGLGCQKKKFISAFKVSSIRRENKNIDLPEPFVIYDEANLSLQVHHKYYIQGKHPWEYLDSALITLCPDCHKKEHQENSIPILSSNGENIGNTVACQRCGGSGYIPPYNHVENGICFRCGGEGVTVPF
jgi:hypothetical protein